MKNHFLARLVQQYMLWNHLPFWNTALPLGPFFCPTISLSLGQFVPRFVYKQLHAVQTDCLNGLDEADKKKAKYGFRAVREYSGIWIVGVRGWEKDSVTKLR